MGLAFIRAKKEQFEQKRDKARQKELSVSDLATRMKGDVVFLTFRCQLLEMDAEILPGLPLMGKVDTETGSFITVQKSGKNVGYILDEDTGELLRLVKLNKRLGVLTFITETEPDFSGVFTVKMKRPFARTE